MQMQIDLLQLKMIIGDQCEVAERFDEALFIRKGYRAEFRKSEEREREGGGGKDASGKNHGVGDRSGFKIFLNIFSRLQEVMEKMSDEELRSHMESVATKRLEKPKKLKLLTDKYWKEVTDRSYQFNRGIFLQPHK